jgi:hypothetical protein
MLPSPSGCGLGLRGFSFFIFGTTCAFCFRYGLVTRGHP